VVVLILVPLPFLVHWERLEHLSPFLVPRLGVPCLVPRLVSQLVASWDTPLESSVELLLVDVVGL
jgi:hypothetical protein